jgi:uncharacterized protein
MIIGVLNMELAIPGAMSLKDKRRATKSLKTRLGNRYNCSLAELDHHEVWNRASIAACVISTAHGHMSSQMDEIVRFAATHHLVELIDYSIETL